jgi:L-ribulokinase
MFGAVAAGTAAGGHATIEEAAQAMARLKDLVYEPIAENVAVYELLYREYVRLHDYFGRGENDVMKTLRRLRAQAGAAAAVPVGV